MTVAGMRMNVMTMRNDEWTLTQWHCRRDSATRGTAMALSAHLRSPAGKTRTSRMALAMVSSALLLGATMVLTSCGNQSSDAAAIVNGTVIKDNDVQNVTQQLNASVQGEQQKLTSNNVVLSLILAPYVKAEAIRAGKSIPDTVVRKAIENVPSPSLSTVDFARMQIALQSLDQPSKDRIVDALGKAEITINPRYGTFDPKRIELVSNAPNWIKPGPTPEAR